MAVLDPLKVVITNYPENQVEELDALNNPEDESMGKRKVPFSKVIYIEKEDFREDPPKKWFRLAPGAEVRLKHAYYVRCTDVVRDETTGDIIELHCTYDPETRGGWSSDGRKIKGTLHWVSADHAADAEIRLYDHLFSVPYPGDEKNVDFKELLNPNSLKIISGCKVEPGLRESAPGNRFQFLRHGYFCMDSKDSNPGCLVFNRTASLRDSWTKFEESRKE
jgi:glutaminyl-tRNA synthetase